MSRHEFDLIVVGAGHAGCEAALAASRMGCRVLLLTLNYNSVAFMPCNPSIGGPAKGHLVREIDALGGAMGRVIDRAYLQMRLLNTQKGSAVWALRAQADKQLYQRTMLAELEAELCLTVRQAEVTEVVTASGKVSGVKTRSGMEYGARVVILATGTFLRGRVHMGRINFASGPLGHPPAELLAESLASLGFHLRRFKTGTPARVRRRSLDFTKMQIQPGGYTAHGFSFWEPWQVRPDHPCWLTYTTPGTHCIIREHLQEAALFSGAISGVGPRYCPSIESKLIQFPDKEAHQVFIEPESADSDEMYLSGLSTSLPETVQELFLRTIPGLEAMDIVRPGYAIEYDSIPGNELRPSLETKRITGLFCAGQFNGSSGYEEAAAQGLMAGINAALQIQEKEPLVLKRSEAYIGVLIDDLVTKENLEPYRILTSRAEYRLMLRAATADQRLAPYGLSLGLLDLTQNKRLIAKYERIAQLAQRLEGTRLKPDAALQAHFQAAGLAAPRNRFSLAELLQRPEITVDFIRTLQLDLPLDPDDTQEVATRIRYQNYLIREQEQAERLNQLEERRIPESLDYEIIPNLAREAREKFQIYRPATFGQATRISGINPADLTALLFYLENRARSDHGRS
jgi:tRNA uridine 5-carboxymethylaminomethyl modification enzyme